MRRFLALMLVLASCLAGPARAEPADMPIRISYAPSLWWSLPFYVATQKNWWAEVHLVPTFAVFPSGPPQVAALQADAWDVGATGVVPTILGATRFGMKTIGIADDESTANVLTARKSLIAELHAHPEGLKGRKILLTANSTSDYAVQSCLKKFGLAKADVQMVNLSPPQIVSAVTSGNGDLAGVWAPYLYTLEEKADSDVLCSGKDAGVFIPSMIVASKKFAAANPEAVARFLAVYLRAWNWVTHHPKEARVAMKEFYAVAGVDISPAGMDAEFQRPVFNLSEQIERMSRAKGASTVDGWLDAIGSFVTTAGILPSVPGVNDYITDEFLRRVNDDPKLREIANRTE